MAEKVKKTKEEEQTKTQATIERLNKQYGAGTVVSANTKPIVLDTIDSGSLGLNIELGIGGMPMARIVEVYGPESCGKTSLCLHVIAAAQKKGISCAMVDMEHHLSGAYAKALGVNLDDLILSQPEYGEQAMDIVEELIKTGEIGVIVVDSVAALVPKTEVENGVGDPKMAGIARIMSQALRVLNPLVERNNVLLLFTNQIRANPGGMVPEEPTGGKALRFFAGVRLDMRRLKNDRGEELSRTKITVKKNKVGKPFGEVEVDMLWGKGFSRLGEIVDIAEELEIIKRSGSWYSQGDTKLGQGRSAIIELLEANPDMAQEWEQQIIGKLKQQ